MIRKKQTLNPTESNLKNHSFSIDLFKLLFHATNFFILFLPFAYYVNFQTFNLFYYFGWVFLSITISNQENYLLIS